MMDELLSTIIVASGVLVELHYFEKIIKDVNINENSVIHKIFSKHKTNIDNKKK